MKESKSGQTPIEDLSELRSYFESHNAVREYISHSSKVHSVGWSCDGRKLASGSFDKSVATFNLERSRLVQDYVYRGHTGSVDQLCWHASHPDLLSTASGDKSVRVWDTRTHKAVTTIATKGENINIAWSPNGNTIAVGNKEDLVTFIDTKTYKAVNEEQFNFEVNEISWNLSSDLFYLTNGLGCVHIMTYPSLELQTVLKAHPSTCICIEHDPTGRYFATGSADALVSLWDVQELACLRVFSSVGAFRAPSSGASVTRTAAGEIYACTECTRRSETVGLIPTFNNKLEWPVRTLSFSFDGRLLASASEDHIIDIGCTETGEKVAEIPVVASTFTVSWHPSRYLVAFACDDKEPSERKRDQGNLKLWGLPSTN